MPELDWLDLVRDPLDAFGLVLFVLVFPVYHGIYPWLQSLSPDRAAKTRIDLYRRSWIERLVEEEEILLAAQQTRNLTMVNTLLASSSLILMGFTANLLIQSPQLGSLDLPIAGAWHGSAMARPIKLLLLLIVFAAAFAYCMTSLRHLGHFNVVIGADPRLIESYEGSAVDYLAGLINRASNRYTLAVRCLYSAAPLFLWLFDTRLFVGMTLFWALKFIGFQDFVFGFVRRETAKAVPRPAPERAGSSGEAAAGPAPPALGDAEAARRSRRRQLADD